MKKLNVLNWSIGVFFILSFFGRSSLERELPSSHWMFVFAPVVLVIWAARVAIRRLRDQSKSKVPVHRRFEFADYLRIFCTMWASVQPLAATHLLGFWAFTFAAALLLCALVAIAYAELYLKVDFTPLVCGCAFFIFALLLWERRAFVQHYGVPIIGHFLERPEYDARYFVEAQFNLSGQRHRLIADIHVRERLETVDAGDGEGMPALRTVKQHDIQLRRLYFPDGNSVEISWQSEPLRVGSSTSVTDVAGRTWSVRLLNEYVR